MDVRILFLTAQPPLPLVPVFLFVESGTGIGAANHLPLTSEPQKVVRTAEAGEECPYVSVRASRIGIYGHTSLVGLRLFTLSVCSLCLFFILLKAELI